MIRPLEPDAQAIVLLCAGLGSERGGPKPLSPSEWHDLSLRMRRADPGMRPAHLLEESEAALRWRLDLDPEPAARLGALLSRGGQLAIEAERLASRGIWILTRADTDYPRLLKERLRATTPPVLFGSGARGLLGAEALAVVGSRDVDDAGVDYARGLGVLCARQGVAVVSGAARGVDSVAMGSALEAGGTAVGVLADPLERAVKRKDLRHALADEALLLLTPFHPNARWFASNAMRRNRLVYALSRAAVVVATAKGSGGTWAGATENLKRGWVPLLVRDSGESGGRALTALGATPVAGAKPPEDVRAFFAASLAGAATGAGRDALSEPLAFDFGDSPAVPDTSLRSTNGNGSAPREVLFDAVWNALAPYLHEPRRPEEVAETFDVASGQAKAWLRRAVEEGRAKKTTRPVRYVAADYAGR